jgi:glyoxylase-like metal-dependent hydrolase (beta-lactamase superfamily II)
MRLVDLEHLGVERVIGAWVGDGAVVDPGPASCLEALLAGLGEEVPERLLLTHIHLDHAGSAGTLARRWPDCEVWVHERGARHLADPARLLASAGRLYGDAMERLWGEVLPVPEERIRVLRGGEAIGPWRVAATPGHASHHVAYLHEPSGTAFCGDVGGVRIPPRGAVLAPTPPPDVDLAAWRVSLDVLAAWSPTRLAPTHFGAWEDVDGHLAELRDVLDEAERRVRDGDEHAFAAWLEQRSGGDAAYRQAMPPGQQHAGIARYLSS